MAEKLKFSNPMMDEDDDDEDDSSPPAAVLLAEGGAEGADAAASKPVPNPLQTDTATGKTEMEMAFAKEDADEDIDAVTTAMMVYYLFEDANCKPTSSNAASASPAWDWLSSAARAPPLRAPPLGADSRARLRQGFRASARRACL